MHRIHLTYEKLFFARAGVALGKSTYQFIDRDCQEFTPKADWPRCWRWVVIQRDDWVRSEMKLKGWW